MPSKRHFFMLLDPISWTLAIFYHGEDGRRNGVGVILKEDYIARVLEVKRVSDRMMYMKLDIEGVMTTVISAYAPQVGCLTEEKDKFWTDLDEVVESIPKEERVLIGADFNGHVGEGNRGDENVMGRYGDKARNAGGQMVVDFAKRMEMAVVNTYFKKREEHRVTYKSGGRSTQVDYIMCRRAYLKEIGDCKVIAGDNHSQATPAVGVQDDIGDQEEEDNKGRANDKMVEIEEGRLL